MRVQLGWKPSCTYTADYKRSARMIEEPECKFTCNSGSFVIRIERDSACVLTCGQYTALRESSWTHLSRPPICKPQEQSELQRPFRHKGIPLYMLCYNQPDRLSNILTFNMIPIGSRIKCNLIGRKRKCLYL